MTTERTHTLAVMTAILSQKGEDDALSIAVNLLQAEHILAQVEEDSKDKEPLRAGPGPDRPKSHGGHQFDLRCIRLRTDAASIYIPISGRSDLSGIAVLLTSEGYSATITAWHGTADRHARRELLINSEI